MDKIRCAFVFLAALIASGCAHQRLEQPTVEAAIESPRFLPAWDGEVRISSAGGQDNMDADEALLVVSTIKAFLGQLGVEAQVRCIDRDGDLALRGALHANIQVSLLEDISTEKKFLALQTLQSLRPRAAAFLGQAPSRPEAETSTTLARH